MAVSVGAVIEVGPHRVLCERDFQFITICGDLHIEHVPQLGEVNRLYYTDFGYLMCVVDAHKAGTMTPDARKLTGQMSRELSCPGATAIFGANLFVRTLATLILKAVAMTMRRSSEFAFFKTESEARQWISEQRPQLILRAVKRG